MTHDEAGPRQDRPASNTLDAARIPERARTASGAPLRRARAVFQRWLGDEYDTGALDAVLAAAACDQLDGDPVWLLLISGPGAAKTETVSALKGIEAHVTSTIASEGALLSAVPRKDRTTDATGGLLRKIGEAGVLVIKDFTSILSMNRDLRGQVLAALREIYDGKWERNVGTDGGRTITWIGRLILIGAVTSAYDSAHGVIAAMGDRFALVRVDSSTGRMDAGRQALSNVGHEGPMREELQAAVRDVLTALRRDVATLTGAENEVLLRLADLVTLSRTAVERDYQFNITDAHAPEMPTRFAKMLGQIMRGGLALGMAREVALALAVRVAGDSMPPLRLAILADLAENPRTRTTDVRTRLQRPYNTIDRELQALHMLGLVVVVQQVDGTAKDGDGKGRGWQYQLAGSVDVAVLKAIVSRKVSN
jgi:hypothetical protein